MLNEIAPEPDPCREASVSPVADVLRHLHVESGPLRLDFCGRADQIEQVAAELAISGKVTVTVDDQVTPDLPNLPCGRLWEQSVSQQLSSTRRS